MAYDEMGIHSGKISLAALAPLIEAKQRDFHGAILWQVNHWEDPVLLYRGPQIVESVLHQSVFNALWHSYNDHGENLGAKPEEFIRWGKRVYAWVRRFTRDPVMIGEHPVRATKRVAEAVGAGILKVWW
jgi:hypothetical protein